MNERHIMVMFMKIYNTHRYGNDKNKCTIITASEEGIRKTKQKKTIPVAEKFV